MRIGVLGAGTWGITVLLVIMELLKKYEAEMPISTLVDAIINHGADSEDAVREFMSRDSKTELPKPILDLNYESAVIENASIRAKGD